MQYLAKIIQEQRIENGKFYEYTFQDIKTGEIDYFLNNHRINYIPDLVGELKLIENDKHPKFFQSFEQDIANVSEENQGERALTQLLGKNIQGIEEIDNEPIKEGKLKLSPRQIDEMIKEGLKPKVIAKIARVSERTIYRARKRINQLIPQKTGRKLKIHGNILELLYSYVFEHNTATQKEMIDYLCQETGLMVNQSTISRTLKKIKITYKTIPYRYSEQKSLLPKIWEFVEMVKPLLKTTFLLATDESGFPLNLAPARGYALKGQKVLAHKPGNRGANYSLILLIQNINKGGIVHWELVKGTVNTEIFVNFLSSINLPSDEKYYLLLDNIRFHHSNKVKEMLASKNIEPIYLVSYSPQLNPVEEIFNVIKQYVRTQRPSTEEELRLAIGKIINIIQQQNLTRYFQSCLNYFQFGDTDNSFA